MAEQLSNPEVFARWQISAYSHYERGPIWYVLTGIVGGGLLVVAILTRNFLLAALIVMVGVVLVIQGGVRPPAIEVELGSLGLRRGSRFFPYRSINHFWIVYDPPIKVLYLTVPRSMFQTLHIPIDDQDTIEIRDLLKKYIKEDLSRDSEPVFETLARILKI
jgi:hypothetical protein